MAESSTRGAPHRLAVGTGTDAREIAWRGFPGAFPAFFWLGGFRSDMLGTKAERLSGWAKDRGIGFCRFDYSGHGESGGRFEEGTITRWLADSRAVLDAGTCGPVVLVGSSMGAWIALRLVQQLRAEGQVDRIAGLLLIAPAPDFTSRLLEPKLSEAQRNTLAEEGVLLEASAYSPEPTIYTRALLEDGRLHGVMEGMIETGCPVHIIQGMADPDVPHTHALELASHLPGESLVLTLIADGDHRLSRDGDLLRIERAAGDLVAAFQERTSQRAD